MGGRGLLLGGVAGVEPANVLILGGGVVGTQAARMASGLGARVTMMDVKLDRLRRLAEIMPANVTTLYSDHTALGNWSSFDEDSDGNGADDLVQTRTHNVVNEITGITGGSWVQPQHDAAGNMTRMPKLTAPAQGFDATYDPWNRLVELRETTGGQVVARYRYDGLGRRITEQEYVGGVLSATRYAYWSAAWQLLEVRVDGTSSSDVREQYVWGLRYVDDLVLRDRDADGNGSLEQRHYAQQDVQFSVTSIVDTSDVVTERYRYTPYGQRMVLDANWAVDADQQSDVAWRVGHQGLAMSSHGLIYNRSRDFMPHLGRFSQRDAMEYIDGGNLFGYVGGNPNARLDPSGYAYGINLTADEASALACAIRSWLFDVGPITGPLGKPLTRAFLRNYMDNTGATITVKAETLVPDPSFRQANERARARASSLDWDGEPFVEEIRFGGDLGTSIGRALASFEWRGYTQSSDGAIVAELSGKIRDIYRFTDTNPDEAGLNVDFPGLSLIHGPVCCWFGGESITDEWMADLERFGHAKQFDVNSDWTVELPIVGESIP